MLMSVTNLPHYILGQAQKITENKIPNRDLANVWTKENSVFVDQNSVGDFYLFYTQLKNGEEWKPGGWGLIRVEHSLHCWQLRENQKF